MLLQSLKRKWLKGRDWNGEGLEESEWRARGRWRGSNTLNVINAEEINKENHTYLEASDLIVSSKNRLTSADTAIEQCTELSGKSKDRND